MGSSCGGMKSQRNVLYHCSIQKVVIDSSGGIVIFMRAVTHAVCDVFIYQIVLIGTYTDGVRINLSPYGIFVNFLGLVLSFYWHNDVFAHK